LSCGAGGGKLSSAPAGGAGRRGRCEPRAAGRDPGAGAGGGQLSVAQGDRAGARELGRGGCAAGLEVVTTCS
ncbi:MAG: hypothetical protein ACK56I_12500, partial [bacterium]